MITIKQISITDLSTDAIVNAANEHLQAGGGVCGAIFSAAGYDKLQAACDVFKHCDTGSAVITSGFDLKEHFRVYETYLDENTKPERRLVQDFKSIMRFYNVPVRLAFTEYDNINNILESRYVLQKLYIVEQQDGSFKYYDEDLTEIKSSSSYLNIPEKAFTAFWDKDFVNKYISSDAELDNIYYLSGESDRMGIAIYYKTTVGDYIYYNHYSIGEKLFPIEDFCKYQKAISDELAMIMTTACQCKMRYCEKQAAITLYI